MPRFNPELPRMIIITIVCVGIGIWGVNAVSSRRILECDRSYGVVQCHLITKQLWTAERVTAFDGAKLQKAIVDEIRPRISRSSNIYTAILLTTNGNFRITPMDSEQFSEKHLIANKVNDFLENPQILSLKVESAYTSLFWIGIGIFSFILVLLVFGWVMSCRFPADIADKTVNEILQESWGATLEASDSRHWQEHEISPNSNTKKAPNLK